MNSPQLRDYGFLGLCLASMGFTPEEVLEATVDDLVEIVCEEFSKESQLLAVGGDDIGDSY